MKFHWLGFSPDLGFSRINNCVYVYDLLLSYLCLFLSVNSLFIPVVNSRLDLGDKGVCQVYNYPG